MKILNIATILPYPKTNSEYKLKENDFLIVLNRYFTKKGVSTDFIKISNYSNRILSILSRKWDAYYKVPDEYYIDDIKINVIRQIVFPKDKFKTLSFFLSIIFNKKRLEIFLKENYICSHAHYLLLDGYFSYYLYKRYKLPYVLTVRDETKLFKNFFLRRIGKKILDNASHILTTNFINKYKLREFTDKDIKIITHGIERDNLYFNSRVNENIRITTVSKLNPGKKIDILLNALKKIKNVDYILNIIGDGPEYELLNSISDGVKCNFLGELKYKDVIEHLKQSDVFVLPSESESFGRVYIEALATSNAVIAVEDTGVYGLFESEKEILYMKKNSVDSLYKTLENLLNDKDKIKELKINGYKSVEKKYTWDNIIENYIEIYRSI